MSARAVLELLMWTLGPSVLCTYAWLYYAIMLPSTDARYAQRLWGLFGDHRGVYFWGWAASVLACVVAFLYFSVWLCHLGGATSALEAHGWVVFPYGLFLGFSALYAPLLVYARPWVVVVDLACVAASAIALCAWTALYLTQTTDGAVLCALMAWLAVHCAVIDAFVWSWYYCFRPGYWDEDDQWQQDTYY
jgi:hypothetical protein